jgi:hypothetical protein
VQIGRQFVFKIYGHSKGQFRMLSAFRQGYILNAKAMPISIVLQISLGSYRATLWVPGVIWEI